jgi:CheY-like chemotaxis protein
VVDDDHLVRTTLQLWLERNGFEVWSAASGWQAIEFYRRDGDRIAVVLLDLCMPGLDGLRTLDRLRELNPQVVTCVMSVDSAACQPDELLRHGATHVIAKPFRLEQLTSALGQLMRTVPDELLESGGKCRTNLPTPPSHSRYEAP